MVCTVATYKTTIVVTTPTFLSYLFNAAKPEELDSLRIIVTGAEECPEALFERAKQMVPHAFATARETESSTLWAPDKIRITLGDGNSTNSHSGTTASANDPQFQRSPTRYECHKSIGDVSHDGPPHKENRSLPISTVAYILTNAGGWGRYCVMPRTATIAPGGTVFHLLNRGVGRMQICRAAAGATRLD